MLPGQPSLFNEYLSFRTIGQETRRISLPAQVRFAVCLNQVQYNNFLFQIKQINQS